MREYALRALRVWFGLFVFAFGSYLTIQANIGLAPWEAFTMGVHYLSGIRYGTILSLTGFVILFLDVWMKEPIGIGTILDALSVGPFVDLFAGLKVIPQMSNFWLGVVVMLVGQLFMSFGSYLYMGGGLSCGPRDSLMVALNKRLPGAPVGVIRGTLEAVVLAVGWLLGAKVGIGTVIAVFGIGFIIQAVFNVVHFDITKIHQESIFESLKKIRSV